MSEQITLHYQCRLCGKQLDRGIHLGPQRVEIVRMNGNRIGEDVLNNTNPPR